METLRVLVVDDEPGMRMGVARALRDVQISLPDLNVEVHLQVDMAESGEQAFEMINVTAPDILLLDHKLPGMTGLELLEKISPEKDKMLTIMITAYASVDTAVTAIKRGAYDFLAKPFTPSELKATVRKAAESLVLARQARKLAQEKRQFRFQFISVLAHELKAPLAAIEGYLNIVKDRTAGDDQAVYDHMVDRSLVRLDGMRKMILDLLDLTRIESGQKKRELVELNVREMAEMAVETVSPMADERKISVNLKADAPVMMNGDRNEIEIIFNNLVSNAVKYNRDNGKVDINLSTLENKVVIAVSDTGIGMTKEEASKLFNDFVRIKNSNTRNILGSGLGLSIVKKIAYTYNGKVNVTSEPNVGSTFTVILQSDTTEKPSTEEAKPSQQAVETTGGSMS